jgi:acetolactate synthase-1/2/3 large subunit
MKGREAFQEIEYSHYFGKVAKWVVEIDDADRIPEIMSRAWATALSGRPGPVVVALPEDMLTAPTSAKACAPVNIPAPDISPAQRDQLAGLLMAAKRPLILYGGAGWTSDAARQLEAFAGANHLPLVAAFRFHDICDNYHPSYVGDAGVGMLGYIKTLLGEADLIIAINVRFGECTTDGYSLFDCPNMKAKLVHCHPSDDEIGKIYAADLPLQATPNAMAAALSTISLEADPARQGWVTAAKAAYDASYSVKSQPGSLDMGEVMQHIREVIPDDAIITNGAGNFAIWPNKFLKFGPKSRLLAPQSGAMGYGVPAAIAAKAHDPSRFVLCFAGDGDFQMNGNELGSAMQCGLQPIILIVNNGTYGTIRMHQERNYPERVSGTELVNPDFVTLAKAYGFYGERVENTADFADAFARACASKTGAVLDLIVSTEGITPRQTINDLRQASR